MTRAVTAGIAVILLVAGLMTWVQYLAHGAWWVTGASALVGMAAGSGAALMILNARDQRHP